MSQRSLVCVTPESKIDKGIRRIYSLSDVKFKKIRIEDDEIRTISEITNQVLRCKKIDDFNDLIEKHESIISSKIKKETVKNSLFKDFNGSIKSLGAWGGDFVLACGRNNLKNYFKNKGFGISYRFNEMLK